MNMLWRALAIGCNKRFHLKTKSTSILRLLHKQHCDSGKDEILIGYQVINTFI